MVKPAINEAGAVLHGEIRRHVASLTSERQRMSFLEKHADDLVLAAAVRAAPQFLSGLSDAELAMVQSKVEARALAPEVAKAKIAFAKALREVEAGWERAKANIAAGGGINGRWSAAA